MPSIVYKICLKFLHIIPAEASHNVFTKTLRAFPSLAPKLKLETSIHSSTEFFSKKVRNFYGVAAGLDKNAQIIPALFNMGFGFVEVGTVTPRPQSGNAKPRVFRLKKDESLLNFMGFPNKGADYILKRVKKYKRKDGEILGVNIGRNKDGEDADYVYLIAMFHQYCDYITINVSSPNTPNLRDSLSNIQKFEDLMKMVHQCVVNNNVTIPIFLKLTPDAHPQSSIQEIYHIACKYGISGFVLTNTTADKSSAPEKFQNMSMGGVSGGILREKSAQTLQYFAQINTQNKFVFSCGGIDSTNEAERRINMGANAVQIYTSLVYGSFL